MSTPRLLFLGFAFPPGVQALYPHLNPAGHAFESQMVAALRPHFDLRSAGVLPLRPPPVTEAEAESGVAHDLVLLVKPPEVFHRFRSLARLKAQYRRWRAAGWEPAVVLAYNCSPVYNQFLLWLRRQPRCPKLVLLLLDSSNLDRPLPWLKRFRYRFKPMVVPDSEMVKQFDACIGLSQSVEKHFTPRQVPFMWMPGACTPSRAVGEPGLDAALSPTAPIRFGYFGVLAAHAGPRLLVETFLASPLAASLEICGYGKLGEELLALAQRDARLKYHGLLPKPEDCLRFGQSCDVLVNPRPAGHGNENNFPSKVFDYALCGRAILTTRLSGIETVLGPEAYYFDEHEFALSLMKQLTLLAGTPRVELRRRGAALRERIRSQYAWPEQARRMAEFIKAILPD